MHKRSEFSLIATSALAASILLVGCSRNDNGAPEPAHSASTATSASMSPPEAMAPVAYAPGPVSAVIATCNIEGFDGASFQSEPTEAALSTRHAVSGWIAAPHLTAPSFWLRLDDKAQEHFFQVRVTPSVKRPDVTSAASNPPLPLESGFRLELPVKAVPAGQYHLYLVAQADGKSSICDDGRQVDFK